MPNVEIPSYKRVKKISEPEKKETSVPKAGIDDIIIGIVSFLISRVVVVGSLSPFGAAFFASGYKNKKTIFAFIGACLGILTVHRDAESIKYIAAISIFALTKIFLKKENIFVNAVCMSLSLFVCGFAVSLASYMLTYDLLLLALECFVCGFFTLAFNSAAEYINRQKYFSYITNEQLLSLTFVFALCLCGLGSTVSIGYLNLCSVLCSVCVMILAQNRGAAFGACAGVTAGLVCALGNTNIMNTVGIFALCGFVGGCVKNLGKMGVCAGFLLSGSCAFFLASENIFDSTNILNMVLGGVLFMMIPKNICDKIKMFTDGICIEPSEVSYLNKTKEYITNRLTGLTQSYMRLSDAVAYDTENENKKEGEIVNKAANHAVLKICSKCGMKNICWEKEKEQTAMMLTKINEKFFENGYADASDFPQEFRNKCINFSDFTYCVNHYYSLNHINELWQKQMIGSRNMISAQYKEFSEMLERLRSEFSCELSGQSEYENKLETKILNELCKTEADAVSVSVREINKGYFCVEIKFETNSYLKMKNEIAQIVSSILENDMNIISSVSNQPGKTLVLEPVYKFLPLCASASVKKNKNEANGDYIIKESMPDSRFLISISDGMGSGNEAAFQSKKTAEILKELLGAKYSVSKALKLVSSALAAGGNEVFSTLDAAIIDLFDGSAKFIKVGAMPSVIFHENDIETVFSANMPIGILDNVSSKVVTKKLKKDDICVMFSDGVSDLKHGYDWISDTVWEIRNKNPDEICEIVLKEAIIRNHGKICDDMSIIVFKLKENL